MEEQHRTSCLMVGLRRSCRSFCQVVTSFELFQSVFYCYILIPKCILASFLFVFRFALGRQSLYFYHFDMCVALSSLQLIHTKLTFCSWSTPGRRKFAPEHHKSLCSWSVRKVDLPNATEAPRSSVLFGFVSQHVQKDCPVFHLCPF